VYSGPDNLVDLIQAETSSSQGRRECMSLGSLGSFDPEAIKMHWATLGRRSGFCVYRPWIVMAAANARAEAAIIMRSGFIADFADFAIAVPSDRRKRAAYFLQMCF
jgi:hypothetical protein